MRGEDFLFSAVEKGREGWPSRGKWQGKARLANHSSLPLEEVPSFQWKASLFALYWGKTFSVRSPLARVLSRLLSSGFPPDARLPSPQRSWSFFAEGNLSFLTKRVPFFTRKSGMAAPFFPGSVSFRNFFPWTAATGG